MTIIGGGTPKTGVPEYWGGDIPWLSVKDFAGDKRYVSETEKTITKKGLENSSTKILNKGDIIISARGTIGEVAQLQKDMAFNQSCYGLKANEKTTNDFLYYLMKFVVRELKNKSHGSVFDTITRKTFENVSVKLPPLDTQDRITKLLSSLDNKIQLNNETNQTLEQIAQAIFKHWFVEFEFPNEKGEPYKSSGGKFVDSELGMIPEGWGVKSLDQIAHYKNGLAMQKYRPLDGEESLPVLKIKELNQGFTDENSDRCSCKIDEEVKVYDGDIIFSWSGTLLVKIWMGGNAGLNQHLFKVTSEIYPKWFYYYWTKFYLDRFIRIAADRATTMGHIKRSHLKESLVAVPPIELINEFNNLFDPIIEKIVNTGIESRYLGELRDTLLPKLMSGEICVPEAEEVVESCLQKSN
jgi:type I restriction enzyme, S subunit